MDGGVAELDDVDVAGVAELGDDEETGDGDEDDRRQGQEDPQPVLLLMRHHGLSFLRKNVRMKASSERGQVGVVAREAEAAVVEEEDPVGHPLDRAELVGDDDEGHLEGLLQPEQEVVEEAGRDRVEARRGLVAEDDVRIEDEGPGQGPRLRMPPESSDGNFSALPASSTWARPAWTMSRTTSSGSSG